MKSVIFPNEEFGARWLERLGTFGSEIYPIIYARTEYESILNGKLFNVSLLLSVNSLVFVIKYVYCFPIGGCDI